MNELTYLQQQERAAMLLDRRAILVIVDAVRTLRAKIETLRPLPNQTYRNVSDGESELLQLMKKLEAGPK
jgi:hypothetical protein